MLKPHLCLAGLWTAYCIFHSLLTSLWVKNKAQKWMGKAFNYYRPGYTLFALTGFAGIIYWQVNMPSPLIFSPGLFIKIAAGTVSIAGLFIMFICIRKYFIQLSGLRSLLQNKVNNKLMITGIHRYVRHPLYAGTFLFIWGLFLFLPRWSLLIADSIITIYTLIGIRLEENKLVKEFGMSYKEYQRKVPMIIPGRGNDITQRRKAATIEYIIV